MKIYIKKPDGCLLAAILALPAEAQYLIIVCHGFLGGKENRGKIYPFMDKLNAKGFAVLAFDFTGAGESRGDFASITLSRQVNDLETVISYAQKEIRLPMILLGRSFGGSTIIGLNRSYDLAVGYIFWSTPVDLIKTFSSVLAAEYQQLEKGAMAALIEQGTEYEIEPDFVNDIKKIDLIQSLKYLQDKPVLICHGTADEVVHMQNAVDMDKQLVNSTLHLISGADHRFTEFIQLREDLTIEWLENTFLR